MIDIDVDVNTVVVSHITRRRLERFSCMSALLTRPHTRGQVPATVAPATADTALEEIEPATALRGTVAEELALVVAPTTGRFRPAGDLVGRWCERGSLVGHVTGGRGRADAVHAPADATVADLLVRPGQLVYAGQGLAWLHRACTAQEAA